MARTGSLVPSRATLAYPGRYHNKEKRKPLLKFTKRGNLELMTPASRSLKFVRTLLNLSLILLALSMSGAVWAKGRPKASARPSARAERGGRSSARESRGRNAREERTARGRDNRRLSAREQRAARREERNSRRETARERRNDTRHMSRRERLLESRRQAAERRREIEEARRRAELARLAAIARQRAADQALRDEAHANIANDSTVGEDMDVRRAAVEALGDHAGTVVVMNPSSGRVYTVVNQELAIRKGFKPCSTIKLITGVAGLCDRVIDPQQTINVSDGNANIDLTDSLAYSNNGYFQSVGGRVGFEHMMQTARELGLGERTGINYANEYQGRLPVFKTGYAVNHMCSHGDDIEVTPIQLASLVSAIANGGELLVPHLPRTPQEDIQFHKQTRRKVKVSEDILRRMVPGMIGAVNYGTARLASDPRQTIAGKTGTCIGQGSWLGLFTSFAPVSNPQLAVVVITRGSGERGRVAAGIAGKIYRALSGRFGTPANMPIANAPVPVPHPRISGRAAAAISDEEQGDEEDTNGDAATTSTTTGTTTGAQTPNAVQRNQGGTVQRVLMPVQSRPNQTPANPQRSTVIPAPTTQPESRPRRVQP